MKGAGTNEQVIIDIITKRTCSERQEILQCYNKEFNRVSLGFILNGLCCMNARHPVSGILIE